MCLILLSSIIGQLQWLGWWCLYSVLRLWRLAFYFLDFEKLERSAGLRSEIIPGSLGSPLEVMVAEDTVGVLPRSPLSSMLISSFSVHCS